MKTPLYTKNNFDNYPKEIELQDFCNQGLIYITSLGEENIYFDHPDHKGKAGLFTKAYNPDLFQTGFFDTAILQPYQKVQNAYTEICFKGTQSQKNSFKIILKDYEASIFETENWQNCYNILHLEGLLI